MVVYGLSFGVTARSGPPRQTLTPCAPTKITTMPACAPAPPIPAPPGPIRWTAGMCWTICGMPRSIPGDCSCMPAIPRLIAQLRLIKSDIERRQGAAAAVTTNAVQRQVGGLSSTRGFITRITGGETCWPGVWMWGLATSGRPCGRPGTCWRPLPGGIGKSLPPKTALPWISPIPMPARWV